jgi:hypothetical protein
MVGGAAGRRFFTPAGSHWLVGGAGLLPGLLDLLLCAVAEAVSVFASGLLALAPGRLLHPCKAVAGCGLAVFVRSERCRRLRADASFEWESGTVGGAVGRVSGLL